MNKKGITLIVLLVTIIVGIILIGVTIVTSTEIINNAAKVNYIEELKTVTSLVEQYYIKHDKLPTLDTPKNISWYSNNILVVPERNKFLSEISNNDDTQSVFYEIDLTKLNLKSISIGNNKSNTDKLIVSSKTLKVYYVKGKHINGNIYFSLTEDLTNETVNDNNEDDSETTITY